MIHSIKEQTVTDAVVAQVRSVCEAYLNPVQMEEEAKKGIESAEAEGHVEKEMQALSQRIDGLTANLDRIYMDRLSGILGEKDFERIYLRSRQERSRLEEKLSELERHKKSPVQTKDRAKELAQQYINSAFASRELLVSLIDRIELTQEKQIIIHFRFAQMKQTQEKR